VSAQHPRVRVSDGVLIVDLVPASPARRISFECVVDRTDFGDVVGIEILDFRPQLCGGTSPASPNIDVPRWSYDEEIDAFYITLLNTTAAVERSTIGVAVLDTAKQVISLEIEGEL